jgi:hypothetical protein
MTVFICVFIFIFIFILLSFFGTSCKIGTMDLMLFSNKESLKSFFFFFFLSFFLFFYIAHYPRVSSKRFTFTFITLAIMLPG